MARRPWQCYVKWSRPPYQKKRSRSHRKEFVKGGAEPKIRQYDTGNIKKPLDEWDLSLGIKILHRVQVSHHSLEAVRTTINRRLLKKIGRLNYHIRVRPHPWQVYRENKMMAFAGADRLQSGMRASFGRCIGRCARVKANQTVVEVFCDMPNKAQVIRALKIATYKLPSKTRLVVLRLKDKKMARKIGLHIDLEK